MKAVVQEKYGSPADVLHLRDIDRPGVGDDEVLVRVRAASVHPDVWHVVTGRPYVIRLMGVGLRKPKIAIPGTDVAGVVESVGKNVTRFVAGDEVFGESHGKLQWQNGGAFAEFVAAPEDALALKPRGISFEQAASIPTSGYIALNNLQNVAKLKSGQNVLINGAAGGVGSIAVQIAKAFGARVTGVDSTRKMEFVRKLGADHVIDYTQVDFTLLGERYDLILDVASNLSLADCKRVLTPAGIYVQIGHDHFGDVGSRAFGGLPRFFKLVLRSAFDKHLPKLEVSTPGKGEVMGVLKRLLEAGQITPVIDRVFSLGEVPQAMRYLQEGQALGKIIVAP